MPAIRNRGSKKLVLRAGYGAMIALFLFAAADAYRILGTASDRNVEIYRQYVEQDEVLHELRRRIWVAAANARDFFLSTDVNRAATLRAQLHDLKQEFDRDLDHLDRLPLAGESRAEVKSSIQDFWKTVEHIADSMGAHNPDAVHEFVQKELVPRRSAAGAVLQKLAGASHQALENSEAEFRISRKTAVRRLLLMIGLCVLMGVIVAVFSLKHAEALERETLRQYDEVKHANRNLERLSARLLEVQEEERRRLSQELHDEIGQLLTALRIEIAHSLTSAKVPEVRERLERARSLAEKSVKTVRNISLLLRPSLLDDLGLVPALQWQAEEFSRRSGIACEFSGEGVREDLPDGIKTCVYRVVQESLHNCEKHANASRIGVRLRQEPGMLTVEVEDDGRGFELDARGMAAGSSGLGMLGMRERAAMVDGNITFDSAPGRGTRVKMKIPMERDHVSAQAYAAGIN